MTNGKTSWVYRIAVGICVLAFAAFVSFWLATIVSEFEKIRVRTDLAKAIDLGQPDRVLTLLDRLDPDGDGNAADYSGESELAGETGMSWLITRWKECGHTEGTVMLYERRAKVEPGFPREQLVEHLEWFREMKDHEGLNELFVFALTLDWSAEAASKAALIEMATDDVGLALLTWEAVEEGKLEAELPPLLFITAVDRNNLASPDAFRRIVKLTGLLEPVETFAALDSPFTSSQDSGLTWIDWLSEVLVSTDSRARSARETFRQEFSPRSNHQIPGLFLLDQLVGEAPPTQTDFREFHPELLEPALSAFARLPPESKPQVASLIERYTVDFGEHASLQSWVWRHIKPEWVQKGKVFASLNAAADVKEAWESEDLYRWLGTAAKHGAAEEAAAAARHLHDLVLAEHLRRGHSTDYANIIAISRLASPEKAWIQTRERTPLLPGHFALLPAFSRDPNVVPFDWFPYAGAIRHFPAVGDSIFSSWHDAPVADTLESLNRIGEPLADDALRFLVVPCFRNQYNNPNLPKPRPEMIAEFQRLSAENVHPGGWLAKDLSELLPKWHIGVHSALLAAGGRSYSFERMETYLRDQTAPVGARVSFAVGALDWEYWRSTRDRSFPATDELALEFAREFEKGTWDPAAIPTNSWGTIARHWLRAPTDLEPIPEAPQRSDARRAILARLEPYLLERLASTPKAAADDSENLIEPLIPLLRTYASLLRYEKREAALSRLRKETEGRLKWPFEVFRGP